MSKYLGTSETVELLKHLRTQVRQAVKVGIDLEEEFRTQNQQEKRRYQKRLATLRSEFEASLAAIQERHRIDLQHLEDRHQTREQRLNQAIRSITEKRLAQVDAELNRKKFEIQRDLLNADRTLVEVQTQSTTAFEQFRDQLHHDFESYGALQKRVRRAFRGFPWLLRQAKAKAARSQRLPEGTPEELRAQFRTGLEESKRLVDPLFRSLLPTVFRWLPAWFLSLLAIATTTGWVFWSTRADGLTGDLPTSFVSLAIALTVVWSLHFLARRPLAPIAAQVAGLTQQLQQIYHACFESSETQYHQTLNQAEANCNARKAALNQAWQQAEAVAAEGREATRQSTEQQVTRVTTKHRQQTTSERERLERRLDQEQTSLNRRWEQDQASLVQADERTEAKRNHDLAARRNALANEWKQSVGTAFKQIADTADAAVTLFPPWNDQLIQTWRPPAQQINAVQIGSLEIDLEKLAGVNLAELPIALPGPTHFSAPLLLTFPHQGSVIIETSQSARETAIANLNEIVLRLLATMPSTRLTFTFIDPVGLGQSFSGVTHLADYGEHLVQGRIWTQTSQIEQRLADLNDHMEKVIQVYLRNEYETITDYNETAGNIAEKYHFLVVADFPANFSETAAKRLVSIASAGARCGVFTLIHWDSRLTKPQELVAEDLHKTSVSIEARPTGFQLPGFSLAGIGLNLASPPASDLVTAFIQKVGEDSVHSNRIEVPFAQIAPSEEECWSLDPTPELRVPIGVTGATKRQHLAIGLGTKQHALIAGKTGSGKSTLFHVIITNLALWYSPDQVEFYLVDFKKGVEFQCYAAHQLPHARVVAIESDREFGLSVLYRLDEELKRRGELYRQLGVQDLAGYHKAAGKESLPRTLLIIDEFQELFVDDDRVAQTAALLLDRFVRQGRAFGLHVLLGSQTLGGAYTLARTTLGQMVIRIALQCNEADALLIMDDSNPAPRLLSRPGEGIYNDTGGSIEGNSPFQTVWLAEDVRDQYLAQVTKLAGRSSQRFDRPLVFDGNAPGRVEENEPLNTLLQHPANQVPVDTHFWLGEPNSIKGPTEAVLHRLSGNNLLVVGQGDESAQAILTISLLALCAQYPKGALRIVVLDTHAPGSPENERLLRLGRTLAPMIQMIPPLETDQAMEQLAEELSTRTASTDATGRPSTFVVLNGLQRLKRLHQADEFSFSLDETDATVNPGKVLNDLICEGPPAGMHVLSICDTYNNLTRALSRKALSEFEARVVFQMSANDSASLTESPKASELGLHRALLYNQQTGQSETFRPYAVPNETWLAQTLERLSLR